MFFNSVLNTNITNDSDTLAALNAGILPYTAYILSSPIIVLVLVLAIFTIIGKTLNFLDKRVALD